MILIILLLTVVLVTYFVIAWNEIYNSKATCTFIYPWAWWTGAFVWEDLLVFSLLHLIFVIITAITQDLRVGLLLIGIFWTIRSSGETLYFFMQQFHQPHHHPHNLDGHFKTFKPLFGDISEQKGFILMQTIHQSVIVLALSGISLLLLNWNNLPQWF